MLIIVQSPCQAFHSCTVSDLITVQAIDFIDVGVAIPENFTPTVRNLYSWAMIRVITTWLCPVPTASKSFIHADLAFLF